MHTVKVAFLLVLVLAIMRGGSWLIGWAAGRVASRSALASTLWGNGLALTLFTAFLIWDRMPGEPIDLEAVVFGAIVFGAFQLIDLSWRPWSRTRPGDPPRSRRPG